MNHMIFHHLSDVGVHGSQTSKNMDIISQEACFFNICDIGSETAKKHVYIG